MIREDQALRIVRSLRRGRKPGKTDMELLEDYQFSLVAVLGGLAVSLAICLAMALENPGQAWFFLVVVSALALFLICQIADCRAAKRLLIEKRQFNFD